MALERSIPVSRQQKLQSELDVYQSNARERLLTARAVADAADAAETALERLQIPKALRAGARVIATGGTVRAKNYRYQYETTVVRLERRATAWFVTEILRGQYWPDDGPSNAMSTTPAQRAHIADRYRRLEIEFG